MLKKKLSFFKSKTGIAILVLLVVGGIWFFVAHSHKTTYQFVTVKRGSITEVVSVTGNVTTTRSVDLAFENGGTITHVYYNEGDRVNSGDVIARLDTQDLAAQLAAAQANVDSETATLEKLQAGATPENIAVSQTALQAAEQTLENSYTSAPNTLASAYTSANDAVVNQLAPFFSNADTKNPQLTFSINDSQIANNVAFERISVGTNLTAWQTDLQKMNGGQTTSSTIDASLSSANSRLAIIKNLLIDSSNAIANDTSLPSVTAAAYKNDITTALNEVNTAISSISTLKQQINSEKVAIAQAEAQLNLTRASSTKQDIDVQTAQVEQAQASEQAIQVKIDKASLVAPMSGIVTMQNAKPGAIASPGVPVTSLIVNNALEVDANVPEVDIGKISTGDVVSMTFDAFPNETFSGKVFYIDPAQTIISGVVDYQVKMAFTKNDARMKSGLTANLSIATQKKDNVLILPQYAIIQNDNGAFVETLVKNATVQQPVTLGISDENGNVEIASGTTEGEQVINIGLK
jgi:HlyD family secretion protein